jgi:ubiquinone/menaquinone biosynthesis C-methylase UbiE
MAAPYARRSGFSGRVTGIDRSPHLIAAATSLSRDDGVESAVEFRVGDSHSVDLEDAAFDAIVAHTLFSHLR